MGIKSKKDGVKVDEDKVQAICGMPAPIDMEGVKRLCGHMAQSLSYCCLTLLKQSVHLLERTLHLSGIKIANVILTH